MFMEFNFKSPDHTTTKFDTVVIVGEEFEINMFEEVSHLRLGPPHARPLPHQQLVSSSHKNGRDETTV